MTIFFQHVGEKGGAAHFPKTIGTKENGLLNFIFDDIESDLPELSSEEAAQFRQSLESFGRDSFQIWGAPSGAKTALRDLVPGDYLLLLESAKENGAFFYGGKILARSPRECFALSRKLWGEARYPIIVLLHGRLTNYRWGEFCDRFGYRRTFNPQGQTYSLQPNRLQESIFEDESAAVREMLGHDFGLDEAGPSLDLQVEDFAELDLQTQEGKRLLRQHLRLERSSKLIREFKRRLNSFSCAVCGFDFGQVYGELGRAFIECHHVKPVSAMGEGERTSLNDLAPVCSNCHRMLHRRSPPLALDELRSTLSSQFELQSK